MTTMDKTKHLLTHLQNRGKFAKEINRGQNTERQQHKNSIASQHHFEPVRGFEPCPFRSFPFFVSSSARVKSSFVFSTVCCLFDEPPTQDDLLEETREPADKRAPLTHDDELTRVALVLTGAPTTQPQ